ncbi:hypothetical protein BDN72DRAFT_621430 [Pluteus cervinus]|uniref:Uncharacterized protein n=1 Tax=Pluteus cervinus TaxID=181527 RepID=A0ACD3AUI1_9AGAR|nr:hypothetical protein BDN72DRAFT_621430 [Pluteus cervinus]
MPSASSSLQHEFPCIHPSCSASFQRQAELKRHALRHEPDWEEKKYPCPYEGCSHRTQQKSNLDTHIANRHTKITKSCGQCSFRHTDPAMLSRHRKNKHGGRRAKPKAVDLPSPLKRKASMTVSIGVSIQGRSSKPYGSVETISFGFSSFVSEDIPSDFVMTDPPGPRLSFQTYNSEAPKSGYFYSTPDFQIQPPGYFGVFEAGVPSWAGPQGPFVHRSSQPSLFTSTSAPEVPLIDCSTLLFADPAGLGQDYQTTDDLAQLSPSFHERSLLPVLNPSRPPDILDTFLLSSGSVSHQELEILRLLA